MKSLKVKKKKQSQLIAEARADGIKIGNQLSSQYIQLQVALTGLRWCSNNISEMTQYVREVPEATEMMHEITSMIRKLERAISTKQMEIRAQSQSKS